MSLQSVIDQPVAGAAYYRQRIEVQGWVYGDYRHDRLKRISAHAPAGEIGATTHLYRRDDVITSLRLASDVRTGFRFVAAFAAYPVGSPTVGIEIRAEFVDGSIVPLAGIHVALLPNDFTGGHYGDLCNPQHTQLRHSPDIYADAVFPPQPNPEYIALLADYLPVGASVVDVGCGEGIYCEPVRRLGHAWLGCETSLDALHSLALHSRPHRAIDRLVLPWSKFRLPAARGEFDAAISIDQLTRERDPHPLLAEIARITKRHAFFSVPNIETLPFLVDRSLIPRHLLDRRQTNFFTRFNLRPLLQSHFRSVEILDYGQQPTSSPDGRPLPYHLFAICEV